MGWLVGFLGGEDKEEQGDIYDCPLLGLALVALMGVCYGFYRVGPLYLCCGHACREISTGRNTDGVFLIS